MTTASDIWTGDWQSRIRDSLHSLGHASVIAFFRANPCLAAHKLARLLGPDIVAMQLQWMYFDEAKKLNAFRDAARDALCRALNDNMKRGWNVGVHADRCRAGACSDWVTLFEFRAFAPELTPVAQKVWDALKALPPPDGWLPTGPDDPVLSHAFDAAWPNG